jgi:hypothetical protein
MCVWKRRLRCEKRGIIKSAQLRGGDGERTNSAAIQSVLALVPEYIHSRSLTLSSCPPPPGSPEISKGLAETSSLLRLTATATSAKGARITWPVFCDHHRLLHGVFISPVWPAEGNCFVQCALTATNRRLPAPMASNTHR